MRCIEIFNLKCDEVLDMVTHFEISVVDTKNDVDRRFFVINSGKIKYADMVRKYVKMRPEGKTDTRFLTAFSNGKCVNLSVSKRSKNSGHIFRA